ncbi:MAG: glycosyltransferase family 4 protein [Chloroflexota bacterium]|nr:glycosyltransferase family 4 protein [Chloroflexota bacterium]
MKIALVSPYDFAYPGGVTNHISYLERHFTRLGHDVRIIAPASRAVSNLGDRFIPIGTPRPVPASGSIARITISPWLSSRVSRVLARENFDIIHLHEPLMPMLCTTVLRLANAPTVGTFHASGTRSWYNYSPVANLILRRWFRRLDGRITVSELATERVAKYFPGCYHVIPNGVDLEHFSPNAAPLGQFSDGKLNILFVGRLEKRKGLDYLLKAYKLIKPEFPACRLIVVGPGNRLRRKYEKQVKKSGLADVIFAGYVSNDDLPRYYQTADIFCAPATGWESFGIILLEAMAMGKAIVASNVEGYARLVSDNVDGLLVPPRDEQALGRALLTLLKDKSLRTKIGAQGRLKASEYAWEDIARRVLDYYATVLNESPLKKESSSGTVLV